MSFRGRVAGVYSETVEIFVGGQKVHHSGAVVSYDPPKPTFAEYLERRERALDWLAALSVSDQRRKDFERSIEQHGGRARWAWWAADNGLLLSPPPRDRTPLPLP